jgi:hypothetical protein
MQIETASIVAGSETPAGDGVTGALRCVLLLKDKTKRSAVLKRGPMGEVAAEAFSALLLRKWGLQVPEPFLIEENGVLSYASADVGYPNLKQSLGLEGLPDGPAREAAMQVAIALACSLPSVTLATACDEAIDNRDRNLGNILWDGNTEAWIDHAFALGQGLHMDDQNKLCAMSIHVGVQDRIQRGAIAQALLLERELPQKAESALTSSPMPPQNLATFVANRLSSIGNRLVARFPSAIDLLSGI